MQACIRVEKCTFLRGGKQVDTRDRLQLSAGSAWDPLSDEESAISPSVRPPKDRSFLTFLSECKGGWKMGGGRGRALHFER